MTDDAQRFRHHTKTDFPGFANSGTTTLISVWRRSIVIAECYEQKGFR